jgi:adenylate cyclase class 2
VCLDRLPFGRFVEIEGEREAIFRTARELGLDLDSATTETYHALNRQAREQDGGKPSESFVFDPEQRARLQAAGAGDLAPPSTGNENGTILGKIKGNQ